MITSGNTGMVLNQLLISPLVHNQKTDEGLDSILLGIIFQTNSALIGRVRAIGLESYVDQVIAWKEVGMFVTVDTINVLMVQMTVQTSLTVVGLISYSISILIMKF